jgi:peptide-methionine (R)-S-oxide reductase
MFKKSLILFVSAAIIFIVASIAQESSKSIMSTEEKVPIQPTGKITKTKQEWEKILTAEQFRILREAGTESPNGKTYLEFKKQGGGTYYCAGCNTELFSSAHKFDSHCGWPSFYDGANNKNLILRDDNSHGMTRTEVLCATCEGHLGHLFKGEQYGNPINQRFCINGVALKFVPLKIEEKK